MKKFICVLLICILAFGLVACGFTTTNEDGEEIAGFCNYVVITESKDGNGFVYWLAYDKTNMVCYDIVNATSAYRDIMPHLTVKDGTVYYTLYDNGELKLAPIGIVSTDSINSWFTK